MTDDEARRILLKRGDRHMPERRPLPTPQDIAAVEARTADEAREELQRHWQSISRWANRREAEFRRARMAADAAELRRLGAEQ